MTNENLTATDGRVIGSRASATRQRLLDATEQLLTERGVLNLTVVDITRAVETSPATFYQYFTDVGEAIIALSDEAGRQQAAVVELFQQPFDGPDGLANARAAIEAFIAYRDRHSAVLRIRDLRAEERDPVLRRQRRHAFVQLMEPLVAQLEVGQKAKRVTKDLNPIATAATMYAMLERLSSYLHEFEERGVSRDELIHTMAAILRQTLTGHGLD